MQGSSADPVIAHTLEHFYRWQHHIVQVVLGSADLHVIDQHRAAKVEVDVNQLCVPTQPFIGAALAQVCAVASRAHLTVDQLVTGVIRIGGMRCTINAVRSRRHRPTGVFINQHHLGPSHRAAVTIHHAASHLSADIGTDTEALYGGAAFVAVGVAGADFYGQFAALHRHHNHVLIRAAGKAAARGAIDVEGHVGHTAVISGAGDQAQLLAMYQAAASGWRGQGNLWRQQVFGLWLGVFAVEQAVFVHIGVKRVKAGLHFGAVAQAIVVGVLDLWIAQDVEDFLLISQAVLVVILVSVGSITRIKDVLVRAFDFDKVGQAVAIGIGVISFGAVAVDFFVIADAVVVAIGLAWIGVIGHFHVIQHAVQVGVFTEWVAVVLVDFGAIVQTIGVAVCLPRMSAQLLLAQIAQTIAVAVQTLLTCHQRVKAVLHFETIKQAIAVAVGNKGAGAIGIFVDVFEAVVIAVLQGQLVHGHQHVRAVNGQQRLVSARCPTVVTHIAVVDLACTVRVTNSRNALARALTAVGQRHNLGRRRINRHVSQRGVIVAVWPPGAGLTFADIRPAIGRDQRMPTAYPHRVNGRLTWYIDQTAITGVVFLVDQQHAAVINEVKHLGAVIGVGAIAVVVTRTVHGQHIDGRQVESGKVADQYWFVARTLDHQLLIRVAVTCAGVEVTYAHLRRHQGNGAHVRSTAPHRLHISGGRSHALATKNTVGNHLHMARCNRHAGQYKAAVGGADAGNAQGFHLCISNRLVAAVEYTANNGGQRVGNQRVGLLAGGAAVVVGVGGDQFQAQAVSIARQGHGVGEWRSGEQRDLRTVEAYRYFGDPAVVLQAWGNHQVEAFDQLLARRRVNQGNGRGLGVFDKRLAVFVVAQTVAVGVGF